MKKHFKNNKGFTLIELLVVVAIIGLLASVVLASLSSARDKGKNAAILQDVREFERLLQLEYNDTGSYANLEYNNWIPATANCGGGGSKGVFGGTYATQASAVCENIVKNAPEVGAVECKGKCQFISSTSTGDPNKYSIMVPLNGPDLIFLCVGSSGLTSQGAPDKYKEYWVGPGCWAENPDYWGGKK